MSAIGNLLLSICTAQTSGYVPACNNSINAGLKQTGYEQMISKKEKKLESNFIKDIKKALGEKTTNVTAATLYLAKIASDKKVTFGLPNMGICDRMSNEITNNSYSLRLEWIF